MISFSVGFFTTLILLYFSRLSYKNYVNSQVLKIDSNDKNNRDIIDKIDDPHDLYSDEVIVNTNQEDIKDLDSQNIINSEKSKISIKNSLKIGFKTLPANLSILRLFGYFILISGFFYLKNSNNLEISYYLIGITSGIILVILVNILNVKK